MPLNSVTCPSCSAHINYAVDIDSLVQTVRCRRCGTEVELELSELDPIIRDTVENLLAQRRLEASERGDYENARDTGEDSVEEAIERAQGAFTEAKDRLFGLVEGLSDLTNTMGIVDEFVVGEGVDDLASGSAVSASAASGSAASASAASTTATAASAPAGNLFDSKLAQKVATKLNLTDEEKLAATYAKELYTYCKSRNIKLIDAISDTEWQKWFISTLNVADDTKSSLTRLVQSEQFRTRVSALMRRFQ